jgi:hypothetical protein
VGLEERLFAVLSALMQASAEPDGAITVRHEDTFASLRVVTIAEGLEMVSLNQILAWDIPVDAKTRTRITQHANDTLLGTVSLVEKGRKVGDVLLRYNFPAAGLSDEALGTLILMVLATGADVRRSLIG